MYCWMSIFSWGITTLAALVGVAFVTLYERKILGLSQLRLGPTKAGIWGILQPGADAVKLFLKTNNFPFKAHRTMFKWAPTLALAIVLTLWGLNPQTSPSASGSFMLPLVLMILSLNVYPLIFMGWSSKNNFTSMGALRGVAQSISYEIGLAFILMTISLVMLTESAHKLQFLIGPSLSFNWGVLSLLFLWAIVMLAETNRAPFDFAEGESELVSGFNTEFGGGGFAMIFMAEYASIMLLSSLTVSLLLPRSSSASLLATLVVFMWVWARATYPRHRYDLLMNLAWKSILPVTLFFLIFWLSIPL